MKLRFTKMQGAGNDFVVLDATRAPLDLSPAQFRRLADRRFGVGADQILIVGPSPGPGIDFSYRIVNADGGEVEQCGNGARCFVRFVREAGLTDKDVIRVSTASGVIEPRWLGGSSDVHAAGHVEVDMGPPRLAPEEIPFDPAGLPVLQLGTAPLWRLEVAGRCVEVALVSMGNPHAVIDLARLGPLDPGADPVAELGPLIESHPRFPRRVNVGFVQRLSDTRIALRVHERGAGETLACGTGACAAVVAGVRQGGLRAGTPIDVDMRGGRLRVSWSGQAGDPVLMSGPAEHVFDGEIDLPALAA